MTIYSQHPSRGKVQILATYRCIDGIVSATVTSVENSTFATPIVDVLNRISACASVPISVYDTRNNEIDDYPVDHIAALVDQGARDGLINGGHSLWYERVKMLLHLALRDLDTATSAVPTPVQLAVRGELEAEARGLREALAEYTNGDQPTAEIVRSWDFGDPFVLFEGGFGGLGSEDRARLDNAERGFSREEIARGAASIRLLMEAQANSSNENVWFDPQFFIISVDPRDVEVDEFYLNVEAPIPDGKHGRTDWHVRVCRWEYDDPDDEDAGTGEPILCCARSTPPRVSEIVHVLDVGGSTKQLAAWAETPVGEALAGTEFVVTERYDGSRRRTHPAK